nr:sigma factor-like helix-turn-helix DNA-binding protein [Saprospiraceae bacterium]
ILEDVLKQLPEDYRMVFALREITGLSVAETADSLHISQANVKVRLNRAKIMLRELIEKSYKPTELFEYNDAFCNPMTDKVMKIIENL